MKVEIDAATGLPALPKGYYWKVDHGGFSEGLYVTIMTRETDHYFAHAVADTMVWSETPEGIRNAASRLVKWNRAWKRHRAKVEYRQGVAYLRGNYPPKKLED